MSAISFPDPRLREQRQRLILSGEIPNPRTPPPGCPFHPRCAQEEQALQSPDGEERLAACFFPGESTDGFYPERSLAGPSRPYFSASLPLFSR